MVSNHEYAHQLTTAMSDNVKLCAEISELKFDEDELISIVIKYNEYKGYSVSNNATTNTKPLKIAIGILANTYFLKNEPASPGLGMSFDLSRNRPYERFALKTRISFNFKEYTKDESYSVFIAVPIVVSYNYLDLARFKMDVFGGMASYLTYNSYTSFDLRDSYTTFDPGLYLGTGFDYKINKSALRFEVSVVPISVMLSYIF
jgi:hypothetical protein